MPNNLRVVITGQGVVSPNGLNAQHFYQKLILGINSITRISRFEAKEFNSQVAAEIKNFDPIALGLTEAQSKYDRSHQFALVALREALQQADLPEQTQKSFYLGMTVAGVDSVENGFEQQRKENKIPNHFWDQWLAGRALTHCTNEIKSISNSMLISTGCTSGTDAIGLAFEAIKNGNEKIIIVGGTEAPITPLCFLAFCSMKALSKKNTDPTHASRPFDAKRDGFVFGEGAAILVLEEYRHALERGAKILGEVTGYGTTLSAYHMNRPDPEGVESARAMKMAMNTAQIKPDQIGYVAYHGSSTQLNEKSETNAVKKAFGSAAYQVPGSSIKSMIGHPLGPAGAMQSVAALMALERGVLPPTINYEFPDPDCDLDYIPNVARKKDIEYAMVNSSGFGGKNSTLIFKKFIS